MCYSQPTTLYVEGMMFVQRPSSQFGSIDFITLKHSRPLLPQDQVRTGFILITYRNYEQEAKEPPHISNPEMHNQHIENFN